jgi:hypothetical protein
MIRRSAAISSSTEQGKDQGAQGKAADKTR